MTRYTRRNFMVHSAAAGALALQGPGLLFSAEAGPAKAADMTIARRKGPAVKDPTDAGLVDIATKLTDRAIAGLGGMSRFVKKGDVVWVKPNIGWDRTPEQAGNTNPQVVAALVRMCFDAGAKAVKVGDNPVHAAVKTYPASGIVDAVKPLGAEMVYLDKERFKTTDIKGEVLKSHLVYPDIVDCDLVINVAIAKDHRLSNATLCLKNYMGVIDNRQPCHQDFATCLADLTRFMRPSLTVLDAVRILKGNGPSGGKLEDVAVKTTVAAGVDIVALDALGLELLDRDPADIKKAAGIVKYAEESGLGKADYRSLALAELEVA
ncbi:MAG: DUF362 domain-containing protein [Thermoguttaceae bacterium]